MLVCFVFNCTRTCFGQAMEQQDSAIKNKVACAFEADSFSAVPLHK